MAVFALPPVKTCSCLLPGARTAVSMAKNKAVAYFYDDEIGYDSRPALKCRMPSISHALLSPWLLHLLVVQLADSRLPHAC